MAFGYEFNLVRNYKTLMSKYIQPKYSVKFFLILNSKISKIVELLIAYLIYYSFFINSVFTKQNGYKLVIKNKEKKKISVDLDKIY